MTQRAIAISRYGFKLPIMSDMVEDHVRSRALGVLVIASVYCVTVLTVVGLFRPETVVPTTIDGISRPVGSTLFRTAQNVLRAPSFRLVGSRGVRFGGANFSLVVESFTRDVSYNSLPCTTSDLRNPSFENTLEHERIRDACASAFIGDETVADDEGVASFDNLTLARGPPGIYRFRVDATARVKNGDNVASLSRELEESVKFTSTVRRVQVITSAPASADARVSMDPQPVLRVADITGAGVENVQCVAFATDEPSEAGKLAELNKKRSDVANGYSLPGQSVRTRLQSVHNVGQRFARLSGVVSEKSNATGHVRFTNLTVETSTTREVYVCFVCEGAIGCWSDRTASSGIDLPKSARYAPPIALSTTIRSIETIGRVDAEVKEGDAFSSPLRVKLLDANGAGVAGARAMGILKRANGAAAPMRFLRRGSKRLAHAISSVSDAEGVAVFENLTFTVPGATSGSTNGFEIVACAEGACAGSSVSLAVKTSVARVEISSRQSFVRFNGTVDGQENDRATLVGETEAQASTSPTLIRVLNDAQLGVPGKRVSVRAVRLASSTYTGSYALPNVGDEFNAEHLGLTITRRDSTVTGEDGFVSVDVRFTHATQDVLDAANADAVGLVFTVDGVDSVASDAVKLAERTAQLLSETNADAHMRKCSRLVTLDAPPSTVIRGKPFGWQTSDAADGTDYTPSIANIKAVDSLGAPVENLLIALVSVEEFETRAPELFVPRAQDFTVTDNTGESSREYVDWFDISNGTMYDTIADAPYATARESKYNEYIFKKFNPRSDVVEAGPSGTARLMYVALVPRTGDGTSNATKRQEYWDVYVNDHANIMADLDRYFGSAVPALISAPDYYFYKPRSPYETFSCDVEPGCEIACVSEEFDVDVISLVSEIEIVQSRVPDDVLDGASRVIGSRVMRVEPMSAYSVEVRDCVDNNILGPMGNAEFYRDVIENCHNLPYDAWDETNGDWMYCVNTSSANDWVQDAGERCGNFLGQASVAVKDNLGAPLRGQTLDVKLLHHPPTTLAFAAQVENVRACPSVEYADCYFDYANHEMVWDVVPDVNTNAFASGMTHRMTVFCGVDWRACEKPIVIVMQPIQGTDETGFMDIQFLFMPGNPGEYTFAFASGAISSPPLTVFVANTLASIDLFNEPAVAVGSSSTTPYRVGERIPVPEARLFKADGATNVGGFSPVFKFVRGDGSDAPVLVDLGEHAYDMVLGWNYYDRADLVTGEASLSSAFIVDGFDGCFSGVVEFAPCGYDDGDDGDDACAASKLYLENATASMFVPIRSTATTYEYCFDASGIRLELLEGYGESTAPGVPLSPAIQIKVTTDYENEDLDYYGLLFAWIAPYDLKQSDQYRRSRVGDGDDDEVIARGDYRAYASGMFSGHLCVWSDFKPVHGSCGKNTFEKLGATITGNAEEYSYVATFDGFAWNQGSEQENFRPVALRARDYFYPGHSAAMADGGQNTIDGFTVSKSIGMSSKPAKLSIVTQPLGVVAVGDIFVVSIKASLASGAAAPYVSVTANVTTSSGISLQTPENFLDSYFGPQLAAGAISKGDAPRLDESRVRVVTDANGMAVFKLRVQSGIPGNYSVYFSSGSTKSRKSSPFELVNAVGSVVVSSSSFPVASQQKVASEDLPTTLYFSNNENDETFFTVKVTTSDGASSVTPDVIRDLNFRASTFEVVPGWESRNLTEETLRIARGDVEPSEKLKMIYSLVVEGSRRLGDGSESAAANVGASFEYDGEPTHVRDGEYRFKNARLVVTKPGTYRTQILVQGIASSASDASTDCTVTLYSKSELNRRRWANNGAVLAMIALMLLGSMAMRKRLVLALAVFGGIGTLTLLPFISSAQSPIWRGIMYAVASAVVASSLATFVHIIADPTESGTHAKTREASMIAHVRALLRDPVEAQRGALDENYKTRFHVVAAIRDAKASLTRGGTTSREAFFYPQRVLGALLVSNMIVPVLMIGVINAGAQLSERLLNLADGTAKTAFTFPRVIEDGYASSSADTGIIRGSDEVWVYEQVRSAIRIFVDLSRAVRIASTTAAALSYLLFVATSLVFMAEFRACSLRARVGKFPEGFVRDKVKINKAPEYTGTHVSVVVLNYYLSCAALTLLLFPVCSENLWIFIAYVVRENYGWIVSMMVPVILDVFAKKMLVSKVLLDVKSKTIRNRALWSLWEIYGLFVGLLSGLAKGVSRFVVTLVFAFVAIARVDKLALPTWLNNLLPMDAVARAYDAMFYVHHSHNAPVFRVAAWLLVECGETHRTRGLNGKGGGDGGDRADGKSNLAASRSKARARTRFELALLLHANPKLRKYRKHAIGVVDDTGEEKREAS